MKKVSGLSPGTSTRNSLIMEGFTSRAEPYVKVINITIRIAGVPVSAVPHSR